MRRMGEKYIPVKYIYFPNVLFAVLHTTLIMIAIYCRKIYCCIAIILNTSYNIVKIDFLVIKYSHIQTILKGMTALKAPQVFNVIK
jgi:hypothetical protein